MDETGTQLCGYRPSAPPPRVCTMQALSYETVFTIPLYPLPWDIKLLAMNFLGGVLESLYLRLPPDSLPTYLFSQILPLILTRKGEYV
jgi:hypothetical protein